MTAKHEIQFSADDLTTVSVSCSCRTAMTFDLRDEVEALVKRSEPLVCSVCDKTLDPKLVQAVVALWQMRARPITFRIAMPT
jgi:hypothetical protein